MGGRKLTVKMSALSKTLPYPTGRKTWDEQEFCWNNFRSAIERSGGLFTECSKAASCATCCCQLVLAGGHHGTAQKIGFPSHTAAYATNTSATNIKIWEKAESGQRLDRFQDVSVTIRAASAIITKQKMGIENLKHRSANMMTLRVVAGISIFACRQ